MVIWHGWGFIVGCMLLFQFFAGDSWDSNGQIVATAISALLIFLVDRRFLSQHKTRTLVDQDTGEIVILRPTHSFFFIPVKVWPYILLALAVAIFINPEIVNPDHPT